MTATTLPALGLSVLELRTPAEAERAAELLREVWRSPVAPVPANLLRTVQHTGGYAFGAYDDSGALLGMTLGLLSRLPDGEPSLHSHITGVSPAGQRRGIGTLLKQHQRSWALDHEIRTITWTCDPLVRRNLAFNLHTLGAVVDHYLPNHYGSMQDGINAGDDSDRLEVRWDLTGERTLSALQGRLPWVEVADLPAAVSEGPEGGPVVDRSAAGSRLVALPADIEGLRRTDPARATAWRHAVREALVPGLSSGATLRGLTAEGSLVLEDTP